MNSRPELKLDWCSYEAAKYAVEHWHYSKTVPVGKSVKIGVWEDAEFIGALIFGLGCGGAADGRRYGLARNFEVAELERVALRNHQSPVSRINSIALKMLHTQSPGLSLVISYADPEQDHVGGIYQAGNWIYVGMSMPAWYVVSPNGRKYHSRIVRAHVQFGVKKTFFVPGGVKVATPGKYKYLYPLDPALRSKLLPLAKPYPKRPKDSSEPAAIHAAEGGATPTRTLQKADMGLEPRLT